jgi:hypothetical protein
MRRPGLRLGSRSRDLIGILICAGVLLVAYRAVLFEGSTLDPSSESAQVPGVNGAEAPAGVVTPTVTDHYRIDRGASAWQTAPWLQVTHRELSTGILPLWNPYEGTGAPLAANVQSAVFDPLMIVAELHPTTRTVDLTFLFTFLLGAVGMYLDLRNLGISRVGAVVGSSAFTLCGFFAMDSSDGFARVYVYLPWLFLSVDLVTAAVKTRWVALLAVAVAGCVLAGMPEGWLFVFTAVGVYALYRIRVPPQTAPGDTWQARAARLTAGVLVGSGLSAPLLVAFLAYLPVAANTHYPGVGMLHASTRSLLQYLIPLVNGAPAAPRLAWNNDRSWCGAAVALLCVVAAAAPQSLRRRGGWVLLATGLVFLAKVHAVPGFGWIGRLPPFDRAFFVAFAPCVACFCLATVAAFGIDAIGQGQVQERWLLVGTGVLVALVAGLLYANRQVLAAAPAGFAARQYALAIAAGGGVLAAAAVSARFRRPVRGLALGVGVLTLFELLALFPQGIYPPRVNPYRTPAWAALLGEQGSPRVFGLDKVLYPDTAGALGLQDIRTLNALYVRRYVVYIRSFVSPSFIDRFTGEGVTVAQIEANPMFNLLGVRYVLTDGSTPLPGNQFAPLGTADGITVYENEQADPRAFVAPTIDPVGSGTAAVAALRTIPPANLLDQAVVEVPPGGPAIDLPSTAAASPARRAAIVSYAADRVEVRVSPGAAGLLVLTDSFFPGWTATVNGRAAPILATDVAFRGVVVGGGASDVVFTYDPGATPVGWVLALVALMALVVAALIRRVRR